MMHPVARFATATVALLIAAGCGSTYVDESLVTTTTVASSSPDDTAPDPEVDADVSTVLDRIADSMDSLSDAIVDDPELASTILAAIDDDWGSISAVIRRDFPEELFGLEQVVSLAHTAVERKRPADASKGWKLLIDLNAGLAGA
jgi:hypothetical protein